MRRCDDRPEEFVTTTEAEVEEDDTEVSKTAPEASVEEVEETKCPSERLQRRRWWCVYGIRVLKTTTSVSTE